jgi:UDPglucose 6-dehydrogenase
VRDAEALVLVTEWPEYKAIPAPQVKAAMPGRVLLDGRNALDAEAYKREGFSYAGIGRR